jgi:hypothetical protein
LLTDLFKPATLCHVAERVPQLQPEVLHFFHLLNFGNCGCELPTERRIAECMLGLKAHIR